MNKIKTWYASEIWKDIENSNGFLELSEEFISKDSINAKLNMVHSLLNRQFLSVSKGEKKRFELHEVEDMLHEILLLIEELKRSIE
jgi:hypothetical protein